MDEIRSDQLKEEENEKAITSTTARFERLESKIADQRKTNRLLSLALLVAIAFGASNFEWVKKAWAVAYVNLNTIAGAAVQGGYALLSYGGDSSATIKGINYGASGIGIQGEATSTAAMGVAGIASNGTGVYGTVTAATQTGKSGVHGIHMSTVYGGNGTYGEARAPATTSSYGINGYHNNGTALTGSQVALAAGVHGKSTHAFGVFGESTNNAGVKGHSQNSWGGEFSSGDDLSGQIRLVPADSSGYTACTSGELRAMQSGTYTYLYFCSNSSWDMVMMESNRDINRPCNLNDLCP